MDAAHRQWFVDQSQQEVATVVVGDTTIYVRSLCVLEKSLISAAAAHVATHNDELDHDLFAIENAVRLMAASIVDAAGTRIFGDTDEDFAIIKSLRAKVGNVIERTIQELSFSGQGRVTAKN